MYKSKPKLLKTQINAMACDYSWVYRLKLINKCQKIAECSLVIVNELKFGKFENFSAKKDSSLSYSGTTIFFQISHSLPFWKWLYSSFDSWFVLKMRFLPRQNLRIPIFSVFQTKNSWFWNRTSSRTSFRISLRSRSFSSGNTVVDRT